MKPQWLKVTDGYMLDLYHIKYYPDGECRLECDETGMCSEWLTHDEVEALVSGKEDPDSWHLDNYIKED